MTPATTDDSTFTIDHLATGLIREYVEGGNRFPFLRYTSSHDVTRTKDETKGDRFVYPFETTPFSTHAEHAVLSAAQALTVRSLQVQRAITALPTQTINSLTEIEHHLLQMRHKLEAAHLDPTGLTLVTCPQGGRMWASSKLIRRDPKEIAYHINLNTQLSDITNPNRKYGLPRTFFGARIVVENAVHVHNSERSYVWPTDTALLCYTDPKSTPTKSRSTLQFHFDTVGDEPQRCLVETKGAKGRVVEQFNIVLDPTCVLVLKWAHSVSGDKT